MTFQIGDIWTATLLGGGLAVVAVALVVWRSVRNKAAAASAAAVQAETQIEALIDSESDPNRKEDLKNVGKQFEDLLKLLPETDRLPGMAILAGVVMILLGVISAGIITLSTPGG